MMIGIVATIVAAIRMLSGVMPCPVRFAAWLAAVVWYWFRISTSMDCITFRFCELVYK